MMASMSRMRMPLTAQVWPVWLPRAIAHAEQGMGVDISALSTLVTTPTSALTLFSVGVQNFIARHVESHPLSPSLAAQQSRAYQQLLTSSNLSSPQLRTYSALRRPCSGKKTRHQQTRAYSNPRAPLVLQAERTLYRQRLETFSTSPKSPPPVEEPDTPAGTVSSSKSKPTSTATQYINWTPPNPITRPLTILGAGNLGRRLAVLWASTAQNPDVSKRYTRTVTIYDPSSAALAAAKTFVSDKLIFYCSDRGTLPAHVVFTSNFDEAVRDSWMVIESISEDLESKRNILGRVDRVAPKDAVIGSASWGFTVEELDTEVTNRERFVNTLYFEPLVSNCVEVMGCDDTDPDLLKFLKEEMEGVDLRPVISGKGIGMVFPRYWGAVKREALEALSRGAKASDVDLLFKDFFGAKKGVCEMMDWEGLDEVAKSERRLINHREKPGKYLLWLEREFVEKGKLGNKSGDGLTVHKKKTMDDVKTAGTEVWAEHAVDLSGM